MKSALSSQLSALSDSDQLIQQSLILAAIVGIFLGTFEGRFCCSLIPDGCLLTAH